MLYEQGIVGIVKYSVRNNGTATATGVTVSFLLEDLQTDPFDSSVVTDHKTVDSTNQTFTWDVGTIPPNGASQGLQFTTVNHSGHTTWDRIGVTTATSSANQPEPDFLLANNVAKVYTFADSGTGPTKHIKGGRLALLLSVDDLDPAAGDDLNFDLTALNNHSAGGLVYYNTIGDIEIKVELSDGLDFKSTSDWTRPTGFTTSGRSATWKPDAVDTTSSTTRPNLREIEIQTALTSDSLDDIPLEERCITAWVADSTPPPSADYVLGSLTECLGDDPTLLFQQGSIGLLTPFPCIGDVNHICRDENNDNTSDSEVVVAAVVPLFDEDVTWGCLWKRFSQTCVPGE